MLCPNLKRFMASKKEIIHIEVKDAIVPLEVISENRSNIRIGIGKHKAFLRLPKVVNFVFRKSQINRASGWIEQKLLEDQRLYERFCIKSYVSDQEIDYFNNTYTLNILTKKGANQKAWILNKTINLELDLELSKVDLQKSIKTLLSRVLAKDVMPNFASLVYNLNDVHFQKEINSIKLKYNKSNWGSCSGRNNLNFSTRLLFAPNDVVEYVIIHELAHLIELNHSDRFWKLVQSACPNYKLAEHWLKSNGYLCDF